MRDVLTLAIYIVATICIGMGAFLLYVYPPLDFRSIIGAVVAGFGISGMLRVMGKR